MHSERPMLAFMTGPRPNMKTWLPFMIERPIIASIATACSTDQVVCQSLDLKHNAYSFGSSYAAPCIDTLHQMQHSETQHWHYLQWHDRRKALYAAHEM